MKINRHVVITMTVVKLFFQYHTLAYPKRCPEALERNIMSTTCETSNVFHCLLHGGVDKYTIACRSWDWVQAGYYPILRGHFIDYALCSVNRYQPFVHRSNDNYHCEYSKSVCSEEGQIESTQSSSTRTDRSCICNYAQGFDYVIKLGNKKVCIPSTGDCSCYERRCETGHLNANYECEPLLTYTFDGQIKLKTTFNFTSSIEKTNQERSLTNQQLNGDRKVVTKILICVILTAVISIIVLASCLMISEKADTCKGESQLNNEAHLAPDNNSFALKEGMSMTGTASTSDNMQREKIQLTGKTKAPTDIKKVVSTNIVQTPQTKYGVVVDKRLPLSKGGHSASTRQKQIRGKDCTADKIRPTLTGTTMKRPDIEISSTLKGPNSANKRLKTNTSTASKQKTPSEPKTQLLPGPGEAMLHSNKSFTGEITKSKETADIDTQFTKSFREGEKGSQNSKLSKSSEAKQMKGKRDALDNKYKATIFTSTKLQKPATEVTTKRQVSSLGNKKPNVRISTKAKVITLSDSIANSALPAQTAGKGNTSVDKKRNKKSAITTVPLKQKSFISENENTKIQRDRTNIISQPNARTASTEK